jgi:hypothetical protein
VASGSVVIHDGCSKAAFAMFKDGGAGLPTPGQEFSLLAMAIL